MFPLRSVYLSTGSLPRLSAVHEWPVSKRSIFEKGLSKCSVTLVCRYIIEKREHSCEPRFHLVRRMTERGTIRCFSLESNILNGGSKWVLVLQREMDHVFLKV